MEKLWKVGLGEAAGAQPLVSVWHLPALPADSRAKAPKYFETWF